MLRIFLLFISLVAAGPVAAGEVRAILVGVGDYAHLDADLEGPPGDVALMAQALAARGVPPAAITALVTGAPALPEGLARAEPTRAAILGALDTAAARSGPGDTVLFYFSGHGAQAPDTDGDDQGGYDEIFLPSDARGWRGAVGRVENAIVDDELRARAQAILDTGAALVGIIDACHAATGFRAGPGAGRARMIEPAVLGLPPGALPSEPREARPAPALTGDFAFLYAAQSDQRAFEFPGPGGAWTGAFTLALTQALTRHDALSWAQALEAARDGLRRGPAAQVPDGEGPLMDAPVFGGGTGERRWRVRDGRLEAGALQGLTPGSRVALYAAAAGGEPLGTARLGTVEPTRATLDTAPPEAAFARVIEIAPDLDARLRLAPLAGTPSPQARAAWEALGPRVPGAVFGAAVLPDMVPLAEGAALVLADAGGVIDAAGPGSSPRFDLGAPAEGLVARLDALARAHRLRRILAEVETAGPLGFAFPGAGLKVTATALPGEDDGTGDCAATGAELPLEPGRPARLSDCDEIWLELRNGSQTARDVTVLYIDAGGGITPLWPPRGQSNRIAFNEAVRVGARLAHAGPGVAVEELLVLAVPADPGAPRADLTALASTGTGRPADFQPARDWFLSALAEPGSGARSLAFASGPPPLDVTRFTVNLAPD